MPDTYSEAKRQLSNFCETSSTEIEDTKICKPRKRVPKRNYDSDSEDDYNVLTQYSEIQNQGKTYSIKIYKYTEIIMYKRL